MQPLWIMFVSNNSLAYFRRLDLQQIHFANSICLAADKHDPKSCFRGMQEESNERIGFPRYECVIR